MTKARKARRQGRGYQSDKQSARRRSGGIDKAAEVDAGHIIDGTAPDAAAMVELAAHPERLPRAVRRAMEFDDRRKKGDRPGGREALR